MYELYPYSISLSLCLNIHIIGRRSFSARMRRLSQRSFSRFFIFMQLFVAFFLGFVFDICTFPFSVITQKLVLWRLLVLVFLPCNIIRFLSFIFWLHCVCALSPSSSSSCRLGFVNLARCMAVRGFLAMTHLAERQQKKTRKTVKLAKQ